MNEYLIKFNLLENIKYEIKVDAKNKDDAFGIVNDSLSGNFKVNLKDIKGNMIMIQTNYLISFEVHDIK